ncbi:MAG: hypothetical protein JW850_09960 [Thermoflexales bacterium]|nr:hypothetical protein [Thermoflexales bacterium]
MEIEAETLNLKPSTIGLLAGLLLALSACAPLDVPADVVQDRADGVTSSLTDVHTVGQTFIARQPNLSAVELLLAVQEAEDRVPSAVVFHLRTSPDVDTDLATVVLDTTPVRRDAILHFDFPPRPDSAGKSYYFFLSAAPDNPDGLQYASLDVYHGGERRADHQPAPGDLWFASYYTYGPAEAAGELARGLTGSGSAPLAVLLAALGLLFLPGGALLAMAAYGRRNASSLTSEEGPPGAQGDSLATLALAFGLSLALAPLLLLWTTAAGLRLTPAWLLAFLALLALGGIKSHISNRTYRLSNLPWAAACVSLLALILAVRFIQVRGLVLPLWVDSLHHTMLAHLIAGEGRIPSTYQPFIPVDKVYYHYGFHALAAYFQWLSGQATPQAVLVLGQILNAGAALSAYLLAVYLTRRRLVGLCAILITGLLSTMPAYYVSWGRYTQLAGLNIMPAAFVLTTAWLEAFSEIRNSKFEIRISLLLLAALSLAGLFLTHYRVLFFAACFFLVYTVYRAWTLRRERPRLLRFGLAWLVLGGAALLLAMPWLVHVVRVAVLPLDTFLFRIRGSASYNAAPLGYVLTGADRVLIALSLGGCLWGFLRRERGVILNLAWVLVVFLGVNPSALGLPTTGLTSNASTLIILYLPFSVASGYLAVTMYDYVRAILASGRNVLAMDTSYTRHANTAEILRVPSWFIPGIAVVVFALVAVWGTWQQIPIVNPLTVLAREPDLAAMAWIRANVPPSAVFLVKTRLWMPGVYMGSDGGWWIPLLTGRQATFPPVLYMEASPEYVARVSELAQVVSETESLDGPEIRGLLRSWGVTHVYIGAGGEGLAPWALAGSPYYKLAYTNGAVWIFEVIDLPGR